MKLIPTGFTSYNVDYNDDIHFLSRQNDVCHAQAKWPNNVLPPFFFIIIVNFFKLHLIVYLIKKLKLLYTLLLFVLL
jgi:hypothetical protein